MNGIGFDGLASGCSVALSVKPIEIPAPRLSPSPVETKREKSGTSPASMTSSPSREMIYVPKEVREKDGAVSHAEHHSARCRAFAWRRGCPARCAPATSC